MIRCLLIIKRGNLFMSDKKFIEMFLGLLPITGIPYRWRYLNETHYITDE